jgi:hypothetical protein
MTESIPDVLLMQPAGIKRVKWCHDVLQTVDLHRLQARAHTTKDGIEDYKKFLAIRATMDQICKRPGFPVPRFTRSMFLPTDDMDAVWHAHILDTESYVSVCELLVGSGNYVHHNPKAPQDLSVKTARRDLLKRLWNQAWDEPPKLGWGPDPSACEEYVKRLTGRKRQRVSDDAFQVFVKGLTGKTFTLSVDSSTEVEDFKIMINDRSHTPLQSMRIIHAGIQLEDGKTLRSYGAQKESTFHVVLRMAGC